MHRPTSADVLYRPYDVGAGDRTVRCLFRDHALSDLIGFAYQSWDAEAAADDFVSKVRDAGRRFAAAQDVQTGSDNATSGEVAVVTVILDGENAWEHYAGGGRPFLRALYRRLEAAIDIETITMAEAAAGPAPRLESIFPGSWINADFYIWAGHADDHRAWGQLAAARTAFDEHAPAASADARSRAWEELLIAEGSDWFWWYGDDHSSEHDRDFDDLFRRHLRNAYQALGQPVPDDLHLSNITTGGHGSVVLPQTSTTPSLDGNSSGFGEWAGAVQIPLSAGGGTMHRVAGLMVNELYFAVNRTSVFLRLEGHDLVARLTARAFGLAILVGAPTPRRVTLPRGLRPGSLGWQADKIVELALPFADLGAQSGDRVSLSVLITDSDGHVVEQHPAHQPIEFVVPTRHTDAIYWRV
jgi:hypothetical protein